VSDVSVSFTAPPVVEVVAGVSLDGVTSEHAPLLNAFWAERLRKRFPRLEQQPPYSPPVEIFPSGGHKISFQLGVGSPPVRLWALTGDGQELLQLQPGWFACNWRKVQPHDEYDRWPQRSSSFEQWFRALSDYLISEGVGEPKITQCEVTYVNHIRAGDEWARHGQFQRVFDVRFGADLQLPLEEVTAQASFLLQAEGSEPTGRLHVKVFPAYDRDGVTPLYVLELLVRGRPASDDLNGALSFMDQGRRVIDDAFVALTTNEMHNRWGMER
jgi:uncharacterized protein (TIGR04255 family)